MHSKSRFFRFGNFGKRRLEDLNGIKRVRFNNYS